MRAILGGRERFWIATYVMFQTRYLGQVIMGQIQLLEIGELFETLDLADSIRLDREDSQVREA